MARRSARGRRRGTRAPRGAKGDATLRRRQSRNSTSASTAWSGAAHRTGSAVARIDARTCGAQPCGPREAAGRGGAALRRTPPATDPAGPAARIATRVLARRAGRRPAGGAWT
jgi:hypothetical protein